MPKEFRQIFFSHEELTHAVVAHNRIAEEKVLYGDLAACTLGEDLIIRAECQIRDGGTVRSLQVTLTEDFTREALIRYCLENNIPIPRSGSKQLRLVDDEACLEISIKPQV